MIDARNNNMTATSIRYVKIQVKMTLELKLNLKEKKGNIWLRVRKYHKCSEIYFPSMKLLLPVLLIDIVYFSLFNRLFANSEYTWSWS